MLIDHASRSRITIAYSSRAARTRRQGEFNCWTGITGLLYTLLYVGVDLLITRVYWYKKVTVSLNVWFESELQLLNIHSSHTPYFTALFYCKHPQATHSTDIDSFND